MNSINAILTPGVFVQNPEHPEWGTGQVQSNIGYHITVNFTEIGKVVLDSSQVDLRIADGEVYQP